MNDEIEKTIRPHPISMHTDIVGDCQYLYRSEKGEISLIFLPHYFRDGKDVWEIYCIEGELFEDVERFPSKEDAEKRIEGLLKK